MFIRLPLTAVGFLFACTALAGDWPQWRGPNQDAICKETGFLGAWRGKSLPPRVWVARNLGMGHSTPSVAGGMVFGMGAREGKDGIFALDEASGKELWFTAIDESKGVNQNNGPGCTPTYHKGMVYGVSNKGTLACLEARTGKPKWDVSFIKDFHAAVPQWGYDESVIVDEDRLICAPGSAEAAVVALAPETGKVLWKTPVPRPGTGFGYSTPVVATIHGKRTYVVLLGGDKDHKAGGVVGVEAKTGKLLWQYERVGNPVAAIPTPIVKDDLVWASSSYADGGSALIQIQSKGKDGFAVLEKQYYAKKKGEINNHHGGMVLVGDHVYFGNDQNQGGPTCVEFETGKVLWGGPAKAPTDCKGSAAVLYADGLLYFRYQNHKLALIRPNPEKLDVVGVYDLPEYDTKVPSWPHPVIANGKLFIRYADRMYCYNLVTDKS
jgi:outer membrane protein assembly factor BamB